MCNMCKLYLLYLLDQLDQLDRRPMATDASPNRKPIQGEPWATEAWIHAMIILDLLGLTQRSF